MDRMTVHEQTREPATGLAALADIGEIDNLVLTALEPTPRE